MLLNAGADPNASEGLWGCALGTASMEGHSVIAQMLLDPGAGLGEVSEQWSKALYCASQSGQKDIVQILLRAGGNINKRSGYYGYALQAALAYNHEAIVQILLNAGADVNAQGGYFGNALQAASSDSESIVELWGKPFHKSAGKRRHHNNDGLYLCLRSFETRIRPLLRASADVNAQGSRCGITLQAFPEHAHEAIIEALRDAGADVSGGGGFDDKSQRASLVEGLESVTEMVVDPRAWSDAQQTEDGRARQSAPTKCQQEMVQMMQRGYGKIARLYLAKGHEWIIQALMDIGANTNMPVEI